jgi:hypothetical protein
MKDKRRTIILNLIFFVIGGLFDYFFDLGGMILNLFNF